MIITKFISTVLCSDAVKMLKFSVLFSLAVVFSAGHPFTATGDYGWSNDQSQNIYHHQPSMDIMRMIRSNGYPVENITVETVDGYLLDLIRIPHGVGGSRNNNQQYQSQSQSQSQSFAEPSQHHLKNLKLIHHSSESSSSSSSESDSNSNEQHQGNMRPAVLLMHGLLSSAEDFVLGGPTQGLAYIMADNGYDVFLGNARGSVYGRRHTVLNPERDSAFWRFCWDDIGMKDVPAIVDKILKIVRQPKLYYVGYMQGSTVFFVMASEKPEYNNKIHAMVTLGPVAFMGHSTNTLLKLVSEKQHSKGWVIKHLGENEFKPSQDLISEGGESDCMSKRNDEMMCENVFFLMNGYNSRNLNTTSMRSVINRVPSGASTKQILHFGQLIKSGRFAKYSMEGEHCDDYNLDRISTPMAIFYTPHDSVSTMVDVEKLTRKLPNLKQTIRVERLTNNMDLLYGNGVTDIIYRPMLRMLRNIDNNPRNNVE